LSDWNSLSLRNRSSIEKFLSALGANQIYLDITGLNHHVWAPIVKVAIEQKIVLKVVYVEPLDYTPNASPRKGVWTEREFVAQSYHLSWDWHGV